MRYYVAFAAAAALFPAAAAAQSEQGQSEQSQNFVGLRVEGLLGYDHALTTAKDGLLYGAGLGYDFGIERLRLGVDAEATDGTARRCMTVSIGHECDRSGRDLYIGGRAGAQLSSNILLYAKGGYTNFRDSSFVKTTTGKLSGGSDLDGIRIGAGIEFAISRNAFLKAEYRYSHYLEGGSFHRDQAVTGAGLRF